MGSMGAAEFFASLPRGPTRKREDMIVGAVQKRMHLPPELRELRSNHGSRSATFLVMRDALAIGVPGDSIRPNVTAAGAQRIADVLGFMLPTAKLVELAWEQGIQISPVTMTPDHKMAWTERTIAHSLKADQKLHGIDDLERVAAANVGKHWVLSNALNKIGRVPRIVNGHFACANFGWYRSCSKPYRPIQPTSTKHNSWHTDYSQICWLVSPECVVDGERMRVEDVASDPDLFRLVFDEAKPLQIFRSHGVEAPFEVDPKKSLDERALAFCLHEFNAWGERVPTANRIAGYLSGCMRNGRRIGLTKGNHCSAAQGFAEAKVSKPDELIPPWRAAAKEHIRDARELDFLTWHPIEEVLAKKWTPPPGARAIYHRGKPGAWTGHIDRVVFTQSPRAGFWPTHYTNVGANEGGRRWTVEDSAFANPNLLGFVVTRPSAVVVVDEPTIPDDFVEPELTDSDRAQIRHTQSALFGMTFDDYLRDRDTWIRKATERGDYD